ncbi:MAG TPA: LamG-like jellyroll fold domain-containing protein [Chloroflexota bacterium]|nr:LamG-like jellyroll fold domain-containing protein [Chloroflexota bacterium]
MAAVATPRFASAATGTGTSFTFGAVGDFGANSNSTATFTDMENSNLNFAIGLGDLSYDEITPASAWCQYVQQNMPNVPFELISGNHESNGADGYISDFQQCLPNQMSGMVGTYAHQYYFDYPASNPLARFILISPGLTFQDNGSTTTYSYNYSAGGADYNWLANAIDSARAAGIKWVVVGMHKVCLTTGGSACDIGTDLENLLISKHVDLVLQAHDHNYQRSKQIAFNGSSCTGVDPSTYNANCVVNDGSSGTYQEGAGTVFVIDGTGGIDDEYGAVYSNPDSPYFAAWSGTNVNPQKGFMKYTVSSSGISAQFVPSTTTSNFTDSFNIQAAGSSTPTPTSTPSATPTSTPTSGGTLFSNNFDSQPTGALQTGSAQNQFTATAGQVTVQNALAASTPNSMSVSVAGGGSAYAYKQYSGSGYASHTLQFKIELGSDFVLGSSEYMVLAQTAEPGQTGNAGKVSLSMSSGGGLLLDYWDSTGAQHYLYTNATLTPGAWHTIAIQETTGVGTGSLSLSMDGTLEGSVSNIDDGSQPVDYFAVGEEYSPADTTTAGHLYVDDVLASSGSNGSTTPTPTPTSTTPTPTATTTTPTPTATATSTGTLPNGLVFFDNFDSQAVGAVQTAPGSQTQFSGAPGSAGQISVENSLSDSAPNALAASVAGGGTAYVYTQYSGAGYTSHTLQFNIQLGSDFFLPSTEYMILAQSLPVYPSSSNAGKVSLSLSPNGALMFDYWDSAGAQHYVYTNATLTAGAWHTLTMQEKVGAGTGSLSLYMDGTLEGSAANIDLGSQPVTYFAVGDEYTPTDAGTTGHLYIDDVMAAATANGPIAPPTTPTPTPTTPTPTATTPTPTATTPTPTPTTPTPTATTPTPTATTATPTPTTPTPTATTPTPTVTPTQTGQSFTDNFDSQSTGRLVTGSGANQFTSVEGTQPQVESQYADSLPNGLAFSLSGQNSDAAKTYASGDLTHTLQFSLELSSTVRDRSGSIVIAQVRTAAAQGTEDVLLDPNTGALSLDYYDGSGHRQAVAGQATLSKGSWHTVAVHEQVSAGAGAVSLTVDGSQVASAQSVNTGTSPVTGFAIGEVSPNGARKPTGQIYLDDVVAQNS